MKSFLILSGFLIFINTGSALAERMSIIAPLANIRSGPNTDSNILWKVEKYYPILVIKKSDSWFYFRDFEDDKGWVHQSLVGNVMAVITKKDQCNIRSGPSTKDNILFSVEKGIPFKVLKHKDRWLQIEHADGDRGWIFDALVW